jgi:outer membrane immunogenic protein
MAGGHSTSCHQLVSGALWPYPQKAGRSEGVYLRILILCVALCAAVPGHAADFTGVRVEGRVGYDRLGLKLSGNGNSGSSGKDGVAYGVGIGYDIGLSSRFIVGGEADVDLASGTQCARFNLNNQFCLGNKRDFEASGRVGYKFAGNPLIYIKAGYANARLPGLVSTIGFAGTSADSANKSGYRIGTGVEVAISRMIYAKGEYRYTGYGTDIVAVANTATRIKLDRNQLIAAIGVRF